MTTSGRRSDTDRRPRWADLDRLLARRSMSARELIDLIYEVNPTGRELDKHEAAHRYHIKRRLQSELLQRFADEMEVVPDLREGVVLLRHKFLGRAASHAVVAELDEEARAWVRLQLDLGTAASPWPGPAETPEDRLRHGAGQKRKRHQHPLPGLSDPTQGAQVAAALEEGRAALAEYDFEAAREAFARAHTLAPDAPAPLAALLDLLVNQLGLDQDAVDVAESVASAALDNPSCRAALALAAARLGDRGRALAWGQDLVGVPAAEVLRVLAEQALRAGDLVYASEALERARYCLPADPERILLQEELARMRAAAMADEEAELGRLLAAGFRAAAIALARRIVAAHPSSTPARALLREEAAQERRARQQEHFQQARAACGKGHFKQARQALASARELGPHDELATFERDINEAEARAKQIVHEQGLEQLRARLSDPASPDERKAGLAAYLVLDGRDRATVRAGCAAKEMDWLDEIASRRLASRAEELAGAVLAARTAAALLEAGDPEGAEKAVTAQRGLLSDYDFGRALLTRVDQERHARLQSQALTDLDKARAVLEAGDGEEAKVALDRVARDHLTASSLGVLDRLVLDLAALRQHRSCMDLAPKLLAKHKPLAAKQLVLNQLAQTRGERERVQLNQLLAEIDAKVRALHLGIDYTLPTPHLSSNAPEMVTNYGFDRGVDVALFPGGHTAILLSASTMQVSARLIDVDTGEVRRLLAWVFVEALFPKSLGFAQGRLWLVNRLFQYVEISGDDWLPLRQCDVQADRYPANMLNRGLALPASDAIWCQSEQVAPPYTCRLRAVDLARESVIPTEDEDGEIFHIPGTEPPILARFDKRNLLILLTARGEDEAFIDLPESATALTVARAPDGNGYLALFRCGNDTEAPLQLLCTDINGIERYRLRLPMRAELPLGLGTIIPKRIVCLSYRQPESGEMRIVYLHENNDGGLAVGTDVKAAGLLCILQDPAIETAVAMCRSAGGVTMTRLDDRPTEFPASCPLFSLPRLQCLVECSPSPVPDLEDLIRSHARDPDKVNERRFTEKELRRQARDIDGSPQALTTYRLLCLAGNPEKADRLLDLMLERRTRNYFVRLALAEREALAGRWVGDDLEAEAPTAAAREHLLHVRAVANLKADRLEQAIECLEDHAGPGPCRLDDLLSMAKAVRREHTGETRRACAAGTPGVAALVRSIFAADEALQSGDRDEALRILDLAWIRQCGEAQSLARLAELYLAMEKTDRSLERFRASTLLADFLDWHFTPARNNNLWLGANTWPMERIESLTTAARDWMSVFSWKMPPA
jgi:hypothetical protein